MDEITRQILITLLYLPGVVILAYVASSLWVIVFKKIVHRTPTELDDYLYRWTI